MKTSFVVALVTLAFACPALAQEEHGMPQAGPEIQKLQYFAGEWTGEETYGKSQFMPEGGKGTAHSRSEMVLGGMFLETIHHSAMEGGFEYEGRGLYTWDAEEKVYRMWWFDNIGGHGDQPGTWDGDTLSFVGEEMHEGKPLKTYYTWKFKSEDEFDFTIENDWGTGERQTFLTSTYKRNAANGGAEMPECCKKAMEMKDPTTLPDCCKKAMEGGDVPPCCKGMKR